MKKKMKNAACITAACLGMTMLAGCSKPDSGETTASSVLSSMSEMSTMTSSEEEARREEALNAIEEGKKAASSEIDESAVQNEEGLYYKDGILIVNKKHSVPADYAPGVDPTAQERLNELIAQMQADGLDVSWTTSNFRDYDYQSQLYWGYVNANGQEAADTFSARPGFSEHQTGLAFDLKHNSGDLITAPAESQWLLDNCAKYGFIVRYQKGKESITGYQAEPWHLRYIGDRAQEIMDSGLTLEEYLGVEGGTEY